MDRGERVDLAKELSNTFVERHGDGIVATGIRGSVARQEDVDQSNLNMVVVTSSPDIAVSRALLYGPIAVEVYVVDQAAYLEDARIVGPWWPVRADQFMHHVALHDPSDFWHALRLVYEEAMASPADDEFLRAETANIVQAVSWAYKARAALGNSDEMARLAIAEAALRAVLALGLRARFVFKNVAHAFRFAPQLPGAPDGLGHAMQRALTGDAQTSDAIAALEDAIEALLGAAIEHHVPVTAEGAADFL
ncbi:MAG TPA: kanamycin nucleotidyltransferase C-terminal domain-containing protein [Actinomycetota bacterium]|nr:kanamycin nucleotidyltransferase C-terminal domain-containing protein [Actinomycetota bacterium]